MNVYRHFAIRVECDTIHHHFQEACPRRLLQENSRATSNGRNCVNAKSILVVLRLKLLRGAVDGAKSS